MCRPSSLLLPRELVEELCMLRFGVNMLKLAGKLIHSLDAPVATPHTVAIARPATLPPRIVVECPTRNGDDVCRADHHTHQSSREISAEPRGRSAQATSVLCLRHSTIVLGLLSQSRAKHLQSPRKLDVFSWQEWSITTRWRVRIRNVTVQ